MAARKRSKRKPEPKMVDAVVSIPITGYVDVPVRVPAGTTDEDAIAAAHNVLNTAGWNDDHVHWEFCDSIGEGNVSHAMLESSQVDWPEGRLGKSESGANAGRGAR